MTGHNNSVGSTERSTKKDNDHDHQRRHADDERDSCDAQLSQGSAEAISLDGSWYVVTRDTGEGQDYAYDADDIDVDDLQEVLPSEGNCPRCGHPCNGSSGHGGGCDHKSHGQTWDYSMWCSGVSPVVDRTVAIAYHLATGRYLGDGGSNILSSDEADLLDVVRSIDT